MRRFGWQVPLFFITLTGTGRANAQAMTWFIGGGVINTATRVSALDFHGMMGMTVGIEGRVGFRADGLISPAPAGAMFNATGNLVVGLVRTEDEIKGLYGFGGAGVVLIGGETKVGLDGGVGVRFPIRDGSGAFIEGRYYRIMGGTLDPNVLVATLGLELRLR